MIKFEKGLISSSQLNLLTAGFVMAGIVTIPYATQIVSQDNWLAVISGFGLSLPFVLVYTHIAQRFPQNNLIEIHDTVYGPLIGKLISASYIFFVFNLFIVNLMYIGDFTLTYLLPETPMWVVLLMFTFVCNWAVRHGLEVIARINPLFVIASIFITFLTIILLIKDMEPTNLLPILDVPILNFIQGVHLMISIPFLEIVIFLLFIPCANQPNQIKRSMLFGFCLGGIYLLITVLRNTMVLGPLLTLLSTPSYESIRIIDVGGVLTRLEVLFAFVLIIMLFIKTSLLYYSTVLGLAQILCLHSYLPLVIPVGILAICFSIITYRPFVVQIDTSLNVWPFIVFPFEVLFPLLTLVIAKLRKLPTQTRRR